MKSQLNYKSTSKPKIKFNQGEDYKFVQETVSSNKLHTVCEEARCPNIFECWNRGTATIMILGDICTRACGFCSVSTGKPKIVDTMEPYRTAMAVKKMKLRHVVITSVDRDDLDDGGAMHFYKTIKMIKKLSPKVSIEILTPDFRNKKNYLETISKCDISVFNHNLETVESLYKNVRPGASYFHSLSLLESIKKMNPNTLTKSGIMVGLGENINEIIELFKDLRSVDVDFITIGQYLRPSLKHFPVINYHGQNYFNSLKEIAINMGFKAVSSFPFARSSYKSENEYEIIKSLENI